MGSMVLSGSLSYKKILGFGPLMAQRNQTMRAFTVNSKSIQGDPDSQEKSPIKKTAEGTTVVEQAASIAEGAANQAIGKAQEIGEKAKDAIVGKSEDTEDSIKEKAEAVRRAMNTKNIY